MFIGNFAGMEIFLLAVVLVALAFLALGAGIFFRRDGKFPETEIGKNRHMRELGIYCVKCEERIKWNKSRKYKKLKIQANRLKLDLSRID